MKGSGTKMKKTAHVCLLIFLLTFACTPDNKVAQELDWTEEDGTDNGENEDCHAGGGNQPCSAVSACEAGCKTNTICLGDCRASLCSAHETMYCEMLDCISSYCEPYCDDFSSSECLLCIPIYCGASFGKCSAATSCTDDTD